MEAKRKHSLKDVLVPPVIVGALGYFVDIYDLTLFSIVRVPSLKALGLSGPELLDVGVNLINLQMIGMLVGGVDFTGLVITLKEATATTPAVAWKIGAFVQAVVDFTIVAFAIFLLVKGINTMKRKQEAAPAAPAAPTAQEVLLSEIRDILKAKK